MLDEAFEKSRLIKWYGSKGEKFTISSSSDAESVNLQIYVVG